MMWSLQRKDMLSSELPTLSLQVPPAAAWPIPVCPPPRWDFHSGNQKYIKHSKYICVYVCVYLCIYM